MSRDAILKKFEPVADNLILILHHLQAANPQSYLNVEDLDRVVRYLNTTRAQVYGVVKYYSMFSLEPRGRNVIYFCISPVCRMMGGLDALQVLEENLGIKLGETTADKLFTLEHSECLGHCDKAPMLMINQEIHGDLTRKKIEALIRGLRKEAGQAAGKGESHD